MGGLRSIALDERHTLAPLFAVHRHLRPDVDAVLQGYCGSAIANAGSALRVAQLSLSTLTFFGGDPAHPMARRSVEQLVGERIIVVASESWRALIHRIHGPRIIRQPRVPFTARRLELPHLHQLMGRVPAGYRIARIDV